MIPATSLLGAFDIFMEDLHYSHAGMGIREIEEVEGVFVFPFDY